MKFNFRKISAILSSVVMIGSTAGLAAAANYPMPFVSGSSANVAIVYGATAATTDGTAGGLIQTDLQSKIGTTSGETTTATGGDSVLLERSTDKFNLMNNMSDFYTKLDEGELSTVLAKGVYTNDDHEDFDYEQEIVLGAGMQLKHFLDSDFNDDMPIIGFDLSSGQHLFNYTLKFTPDDAQGADTSWSGIKNSYMPLLGQTYYVLSMTNTTGTNHKITLLNSAVDGELGEGESITLTAGSQTYDVSVAYIDSSHVKLTINGETTDSLQAGETQKLSTGDYVGIKEVSFQQVTGGASNVAFSIGSGKLVLENDKEVEINNEKLSKTEYPVENSDETVSYKVYSYINTAGTNLDSIVLKWDLDDDSWIAPGTDMVLPGFESVKLSMGSFVVPSEEITKIKGDSNRLTVSTTLTDGDINLDILYLNSTSTGIAGLGRDSTHKLVTSNTTGDVSTPIVLNLNETENSYFVVSWINGDDFESYAYKLSSVDEDDKNKTVLENLISGGTDITLDEVNDYDTDGNVKFTLHFANEKYPSKAYVTINVTSVSGSVYADRLVTADGLQMRLPVSISDATGGGADGTAANPTGYLNCTDVNPVHWYMNVTEEDKDENIARGKSFIIDMGFSGTDGIEPATITGSLSSTTMYESEDDSNTYVGYMPSDIATKLVHDRPTSGLNELTITYPGAESYAEIYVAETGVTISSGSSQMTDVVMVTDSEVATVSTKNLIIVGGSCINSAAAHVLGGSYCGAAFTQATGVGTGQFLIKGVSGAYTSGKIALVVAGYEAADTTAAATYLRTQTVDTSKEYKGTTSTMMATSVEETA